MFLLIQFCDTIHNTGKVNNDMDHAGSEVYSQSIPAISYKKPIRPLSLWKNEKPSVQHVQKIFIYDTQGVLGQHATPKTSSPSGGHKQLNNLKKVSPISTNSNIVPHPKTHQKNINNVTIRSTQSNNFFKPFELNKNTSSMTSSGNLPLLDQQRSKKEIASTSGMRQLVWNTATALWSVNKEHFLPTFLHTKTGGKLSLVRDSLFKPITIISQFNKGVQEINNEKIRNLARLSRGGGGYGWGPVSTYVVKSHPNHLMTLARYVFRLTKHTAITKWRLKRALLDLQIRALRKLIRILQSNTVAQKVATIRILTGAAWKGKMAFLNFLQDFGRGLGRTTTTPAPAPYSGNDNAVNVDITYSSLNNKYNNEQHWMDYLKPATPAPTPSPLNTYFTTPGYYNHNQQSYDTPAPSPTTLNTYFTTPRYYNHNQQSYNTPAPSPTPLSTYYTPAYYNALQNSYETPPPPPTSSGPAPSTVFVPPATAPPNMKIRQYLYHEPNLGSFSTQKVHFTAPVTAAKASEPLIEAPSYATALKVMGINPTNYSFNDAIGNRIGLTTTTTERSIQTTLLAPKPTLVYYETTVEENKSNEMTTNFGSTQNMNIIEEPTISYSYHSTDRVPSPSEMNVQHTSPIVTSTPSLLTTGMSNTTPSNFRMKLLEALLGTARQV